MSKKGAVLIGLGIACVISGVLVLATETAAEWVPYGFATLWGATIALAADYFRGK